MENTKYTSGSSDEKRIISSLQNKLVLNGIIFLLFIGFIMFNILPGFGEYSTQKEILSTKITEFTTLTNSGLSYGDFSSLVTDESKKKLISKIGNEFYDTNLKNTSSGKYLDFIAEKTTYINKIKSSNKVKLRDQKISVVLPSYQEGMSVDGTMSDLDFVNYVENLLKSFGLKTTSVIGINDIVLLQDKTIPIQKTQDSLASQIFYIPLKLDLEGRKADVIDFLYYLQNVGRVEKVENDNVKFYSDNFLLKRIQNYQNLYETKIVDIASVEIPTYIDTSSIPRNTSEKSALGFVSFIKNGVENNDVFKVSLDLRFYVKGLPMYKLEEYISKIVTEYKAMKTKLETSLGIAKNRKITSLNTQVLSSLSNLKTLKVYIDDLDQTMKKLEAGVRQKNNLEILYKDASKLKYDLSNIEEILETNVQILNKNNK